MLFCHFETYLTCRADTEGAYSPYFGETHSDKQQKEDYPIILFVNFLLTRIKYFSESILNEPKL